MLKNYFYAKSYSQQGNQNISYYKLAYSSAFYAKSGEYTFLIDREM